MTIDFKTVHEQEVWTKAVCAALESGTGHFIPAADDVVRALRARRKAHLKTKPAPPEVKV